LVLRLLGLVLAGHSPVLEALEESRPCDTELLGDSLPIVVELSQGGFDDLSFGELEQILELQRSNLAHTLREDDIASQGFVTVEHSLEVLRRMHAIRPSIVAKDGEQLAGYALVMPVECRSFIPILEPMFDRLDSLGIGRQRFYVMGQICVGKPWRSRGVFDLMYFAHRR